MINVKRSILVIALLSISTFPALSMQDEETEIRAKLKIRRKCNNSNLSGTCDITSFHRQGYEPLCSTHNKLEINQLDEKLREIYLRPKSIVPSPGTIITPVSIKDDTYDVYDDDYHSNPYPDMRSKKEKKRAKEIHDSGKRNNFIKKDDGSDQPN